jgi:hypothetical protein
VTPIFFPIGWHNSKIPGYAVRVSVPDIHGFTALVVFSSVAARFFPPQTIGLGVPVGQIGTPFRIDHDEKFNQTTACNTSPGRPAPGSVSTGGMTAVLLRRSVPFVTDTTTPVDLTGLTADQQLQAGLFCGSQHPTLSTPRTTCAPSQYGSTLVKIPAPGTQDPDHNPQRIAPGSLFDLSGVTTTSSKPTGTSGVSASRPSISRTNWRCTTSFPHSAHALRHAARADRSDWIPLLADAPRR